MTKQVIINADDLGLSSGVNRAVVRAWRDGILTSASLMPSGEAFAEAVEIARENPGLQVGLHLTLVHGKAVLPPAEIPGLVSADGSFTDNPVAAGMRYFFLPSLRDQLRREIEAQLRAVTGTGLDISHVDGHVNIHVQPVVFAILAELMPRYGIRSFRLTRERLQETLRLDPTRPVGKRADAFIFDRLAAHSLPVLDRLGIGYADEVKGLLNSGRMTEEYLLALLECVRDGLTEIYFHPGCLPCATITGKMPNYRHEDELVALTSPRVREEAERLGIVFRNYRGEVKR
jgi:chitin disaccharide deacetylase